jgi:uncharacterized damage-inducible protein DinB
MEDDLRFPIGEFTRDSERSSESRKNHVRVISELPARLVEAVKGLTDEQLDTPYRPGGWTVRQTLHHVADSHANSLIRFKLALTEDNPTIRPYYEDRWAELPDCNLPIDVSLKMIEGIHARWTALLRGMSDADFDKKFIHPETGEWKLDDALALYAWHAKHHTAHINNLAEREGWSI